MIQILALRPYADPKTGKTYTPCVWHEKGLVAPSVEDVLLDPHQFLEVPESEKWNVYYTISEVDLSRGTERKFVRQYHIPFDVDGIDVPDGASANPRLLEPTARLICQAIGVEYEETGVVYSGNGLQFLVGLETAFEDPLYFDQARKHYRAICDRITLRLQEHKVRGVADPSVWSPARLMRYPATQNRKPDKPIRHANVMQPNVLRGGFRLEIASGLPDVSSGDQINPTVAKQIYTPDEEEIMGPNGCSFLRWAQANPAEVSEPQWYAGVSITARFSNGIEASHRFSKGHPKYSHAETEIKTKQALENSGPRTCGGIQKLWGKCQTCPHFEKITSPIAIVGESHIKTKDTGFRNVIIDKNGNPRRGQPCYEDLLKLFDRTHNYVSVMSTPQVLVWTGKLWEEKSKDYITAFAQEHVDPMPNNTQRGEFYGYVKNTNPVTPEWLQDGTQGLFNFANGVFDIADNTLKPHYKGSKFRFVLPCDYQADAECPRFEQFMREVTCGREDLQQVLQEFMGYCLSGMEPIYEKALILLGIGANGKSTFVNIMRALCGKSGYSSLSVKAMVSDQNRYLLMNKLVNLAEENSRDSFKDTEFLKNFISGGEIQCKMLYAQPFEFKNNAKLIMLCNELPRNFDQTSGFFRKIMVVPFDAKFNEKDADVGLKDRLMGELSGIFNYAIEGYRRLQKQGNFTVSQTIKDHIENYSVESNIVKAWYLEELEYMPTSSGHTMQRQQLFNIFIEYCAKVGVDRPLTQAEFWRNLQIVMQGMGHEFNELNAREGASRTRELKFLRLRQKGFDVVVNHATGSIKAKEMYD